MTENMIHCPYPECKNAPPIPESLFQKHKKLVHSNPNEQSNDVQFFSQTARGLLHSQKNKILKFLENRSIEYAGAGVYVCHPIPTYNKRTYHMRKDDFLGWTCDCQSFIKRAADGEAEPICSHIGALLEFMARGQKYE